MLDPHPYFSSNDVTCPKCGADNLSERELRPSGGCVHCTCSGCGEAAADLVDGPGGPVCEDCRTVPAEVIDAPTYYAVELRAGFPVCPCVERVGLTTYAREDCEHCRGAGVLETPPHVALSCDGCEAVHVSTGTSRTVALTDAILDADWSHVADDDLPTLCGACSAKVHDEGANALCERCGTLTRAPLDGAPVRCAACRSPRALLPHLGAGVAL